MSEGDKLAAYSQGVYQEFEEIDEGVFRGKRNPDVVFAFSAVFYAYVLWRWHFVGMEL